MSFNETDRRLRFFRGGTRRSTSRLKPLRPVGAAELDVAELDGADRYVERLRDFGQHAQPESAACQSMIVATLRTLDHVRRCAQRSAERSITLAQRESMQRQVVSLDAARDALRNLLSAQGARMLEITPQPTDGDDTDPSWWFALTETIQALEDSVDRLASMVAGQPKGAPARWLISIVARLLRFHHRALLGEAEAWIE